jgi:hypothetical protein
MTALKAPSLTELIALYGGYDRVTTAAWGEFDAAVKAWNAARMQALVAEVVRDKDRR